MGICVVKQCCCPARFACRADMSMVSPARVNTRRTTRARFSPRQSVPPTPPRRASSGIDADGDKQRPQLQITFRQLFIRHQNARRFSRRTNLRGLFNRRLHFRVLRIAGKPISALVRRADKHAVYAVNIEDLRQIIQRFTRSVYVS